MSSTKPTLKLDVYGSIDVNPEEASSYFKYKLQTDDHNKKFFWDVPHQLPSDEIIGTDRNPIQTSIQEKKLDEISFPIKSKIEDDLKQQDIFDKEIDENSRIINKSIPFVEKFKGLVKDFEQFEKVFNEVDDNSDTYSTIDDFISKTDAIILGQMEIVEHEQKLIKNNDLIRQKIFKSTFETAQKINEIYTNLDSMERAYKTTKARTKTGSNAVLVRCKPENMKFRAYKTTKARTVNLETTLLKAREYIRENDKETITLMDSIQHLYLLMKEKNHEKVELKQYDISGQLNYIREELEVVEDEEERNSSRESLVAGIILGIIEAIKPDKKFHLSSSNLNVYIDETKSSFGSPSRDQVIQITSANQVYMECWKISSFNEDDSETALRIN
ncbi:CLUMA_CG006129, isoform A [Clunio marinus]|uniref:CLUMA_CG006129, isoform A n=1 Tax=Clunio marinus TaxID=568069 RepID=A0A1J1I2F3_9DIPT|nr:CLUMA_CG006129, isoform A [Clunio marinus]